MPQAIVIEEQGSVLVVRFNRPEIRSPLSIAVLDALHDIIDTARKSGATKAVIFTGTDTAFASGADLREIDAINSEKVKEFAIRGQDLMAKIGELSQKTVAAINGFCFGGALDLALACDMRIASPDAAFAHPGAGLGIITGWGGTQRLPRLIGTANALEMFFTATAIGATRALEIGLIDRMEGDVLYAALRSVE